MKYIVGVLVVVAIFLGIALFKIDVDSSRHPMCSDCGHRWHPDGGCTEMLIVPMVIGNVVMNQLIPCSCSSKAEANR